VLLFLGGQACSGGILLALGIEKISGALVDAMLPLTK